MMAEAQPVDQEVQSVCRALMEAAEVHGVRMTFELEMQGVLTLVRTKGGLLNLFRSTSTVQQETDRLKFNGTLDPDLHLKIVELQTQSTHLTDKEIQEAQMLILLLARAKLQHRDWHRVDGTSKLPDLDTDWNNTWAYWLGKVLLHLNHPPIGRRSLNRETFGWLRCTAGQLTLDETSIPGTD